MAFTAKDVANLREQTGAGMMDCKRALTEADGNMEKAAELLRERGVSVAAKKASRIASEGVVFSFVAADGKTGALAEINCESDFVAKSDVFADLAVKTAEAVVINNPKDNEALLAAKYDSKDTVTDLINAATAKIGEKLALRRFARYETKCGRIETYIHMGGKIGVMLEVATDKELGNNEAFKAVCHDVAMHIAAFSPKYVCEQEVPADEVAHEKEILKAQAMNEGKPAAVAEKMVAGRIKKFFKEICLLDQEYLKDTSITVAQALADAGKQCGATLTVKRFERLVMGEGLEKKVDNLAEEVAKIQQGA
ncbi:MAG: elongation factor Ts [Clostridia bacterium]|nr:elongation factor Ts [Clostridia bacterium]